MKQKISHLSLSRRCNGILFGYAQCVIIIGFVVSAQGQTDSTRIYGIEDQSIPVPVFIGSPGQMDSSALDELVHFLGVINITSWQGMQAAGTLTDGGGVPNPAIITLLGPDSLRLDVETTDGVRSTRVQGNYGTTVEANGRSFPLPFSTAKSTVPAFSRLLNSTTPASTTSYIDQGLVQVDGKMLHRITLEEAVTLNSGPTDQQDFNVTDLYFDPVTHLLIKSASSLQLAPFDPQKYLVVVSYSDYRTDGESLVPFRLTQSLNGQHQWSLQLADTNLKPNVGTSYFTF